MYFQLQHEEKSGQTSCMSSVTMGQCVVIDVLDWTTATYTKLCSKYPTPFVHTVNLALGTGHWQTATSGLRSVTFQPHGS
ncbi:uncharacterized protein N7496_000217 [Penicillium cataractarum]|uniref:Uncharacterized protein n=1 Tax=Penicillium cataractarum TaxID=2100454 RepID=A0A9X0B5Q1_9EURO|nr:uncharacterized protein N7496_000217 [Penicillium cataractarum]KAJ5389149.1 hypothetical protein N7496_000217 [Penicillium cataractarum]